MNFGDFTHFFNQAFAAAAGKPQEEHILEVDSLDTDRQTLTLKDLPNRDEDIYFPGCIIEFGTPEQFRVISGADVSGKKLQWRDKVLPTMDLPTHVKLRTTPLAGAQLFLGGGENHDVRSVTLSRVGLREIPSGVGSTYGSTQHQMFGSLWIDYPTPSIKEILAHPNVQQHSDMKFLQFVMQAQWVVTTGLETGLCRRVFTPDIKFYAFHVGEALLNRAEVMLSFRVEV